MPSQIPTLEDLKKLCKFPANAKLLQIVLKKAASNPSAANYVHLVATKVKEHPGLVTWFVALTFFGEGKEFKGLRLKRGQFNKTTGKMSRTICEWLILDVLNGSEKELDQLINKLKPKKKEPKQTIVSKSTLLKKEFGVIFDNYKNTNLSSLLIQDKKGENCKKLKFIKNLCKNVSFKK